MEKTPLALGFCKKVAFIRPSVVVSLMALWRAIACGLIFLGVDLCAKQPVVACSFSIPADWAKNLVDDQATILTLAGANTDLHTFQPSPGDIKGLLEADLIVGIDPLMEPWLQDLIKSNKLEDKVLWIGKAWISEAGLAPCPCGDPTHHAAPPSNTKLVNEDPHLWTDPVLVEAMIDLLAARLRQLSGIDGAKIEAQRVAYKQAIRLLDQELSSRFKAIPGERRLMITHHGNLGRFARRYGIEIVGVVLQSSTTEAADPSARGLARLTRLVWDRGVKVIVFDRGQRAPAAFALAREAGLPPPLELSVDALDRPGTAADSWLGMMRDNGRRLAEALER